MSLIDWFAARRKDQFVGKVSQDTDEGDGLWVKCSECSQVAYRKDLISNYNVCSNCGHHNRINSDERINIIADKNSFEDLIVHSVLRILWVLKIEERMLIELKKVKQVQV